MVWSKYIIRVSSLLFTSFFSLLLVITYIAPDSISKAAKDIVFAQLKKEALEEYRGLSTSMDHTIIGRMGKRYLDDQLKYYLEHEDEWYEKIYTSLNKAILELQKEGEDRWHNLFYSSNPKVMEFLVMTDAYDTVKSFLKMRYVKVKERLLKEIRTFLLSNGIMCLLIFILSFVKIQYLKALFLPLALMLLAVMFSVYAYVAKQDWFYTIFYGDYFGWYYLGYLSLVFLLLLDVFLNRARVTQVLLGGLGSWKNL